MSFGRVEDLDEEKNESKIWLISMLLSFHLNCGWNFVVKRERLRCRERGKREIMKFDLISSHEKMSFTCKSIN